MANITLKGNPIHTSGDLPKVGSKAPDFLLVDSKLKDQNIHDFKGKKKILYTVPSLDTSLCSLSAKKFSEEAAARPEIAILVISADLPFAQGRVCGAENIKNIHTLSMMRSKEFAKDYGILIIDGPLAGVCARSVIVLDEHDTVLYTELVKEVTTEPNYESALKATQ